MRLRNPKFPTTQEINAMTMKEIVKEMNRKYVVKHVDGYEQRKQWNTTDKNNATLFNSYSEALDYSTRGCKIYQTY